MFANNLAVALDKDFFMAGNTYNEDFRAFISRALAVPTSIRVNNLSKS